MVIIGCRKQYNANVNHHKSLISYGTQRVKIVNYFIIIGEITNFMTKENEISLHHFKLNLV